MVHCFIRLYLPVLKHVLKSKHLKTMKSRRSQYVNLYFKPVDVITQVLSTAERRCTPVLLSAPVSDTSGNSQQMAAPRR